MSVLFLIQKEFKLELRRKAVISSLGLYLLSLVLISYFAFTFRQDLITPPVWNALFWISILFTVISTVAKSFIGEKRGADFYFYTIASAHEILFSKIIYYFILCFLLESLGFGLFALFLNNPIQNTGEFLLVILLSAAGFASTLTFISGIAARASNSNLLMAVMSFPLIISILLLSIKTTKNCMDGLDFSASSDEFVSLIAINCMVNALSYLLFPFIWRS
jgi:heme exporter protein B